MNILFFVSSFLVILSFLCASTFHTVASFESEKIGFLGNMTGLRQTRNKWQNKLFVDATKAPNPQAAAINKIPKIIKEYKSHRDTTIPYQYSKLNIADLLNTESSSKLLQKTVSNLLKNLYGHAPFIKESGLEHFEEILTKEMIKSGKKNKAVSTLQDLSPESEPLKSLYYKILKGSGDYNLKKNLGYPPLSDFLFLDEKERKPIYFHFASYHLLLALLGKDLADEILEKEESKSKISGGKRTLTEEEFKALLISNRGFKSNSVEIEDLLSFAKKKIPLQSLSHKDKETGVFYILPL